MKKIILLLIIFLILIKIVSAFPTPTGYINDYANIINDSEEQKITSLITEIEQNTSVEIAVVTVESLESMSIEEYAVKLFEQWGIGKEEKDNGLLIIVAPNQREYRIEVGYGLEGMINDARAGRIGRNILTPYFKEEKYGEGIYLAIKEIQLMLKGEYDDTARAAEELVLIKPLIVLGFYFLIVYFFLWGTDSIKKKNLKKGIRVLPWAIIFPVFFFSIIIAGFMLIASTLAFLVFFLKGKGFIFIGGPGFGGRSSGGFGGFGGGSSGGGGFSGRW